MPLALVATASAWLVSTVPDTGDWAIDAWPAVDALVHFHVSEYLRADALMGPFSTLLQAPFAALSPGGTLASYRWASFPCVLAAGLLGLYLARVARRRGAAPATAVLLPALCLVNPLTVDALRNGHPEEILTAALAVAAVTTASEGHRGRTAVLLALAVCSKQWAVIAIMPALMALPKARLRTGLWAAAIGAGLTIPGVIASPGGFLAMHETAAQTGRIVAPWSFWYPFAEVTTEVHRVGSTILTANVHELPAIVGVTAHPLIVAMALVLPLGLMVSRRSFHLCGAEAMALLALLALVRCAIDPLDNLYYHAPLLLALLGWDATAGERFPLRGLTAAAMALMFWNWAQDLTNVTAFNWTYIMVAICALAAIARSLWIEIPDFSGKDAQISGIKLFRRWSMKSRDESASASVQKANSL